MLRVPTQALGTIINKTYEIIGYLRHGNIGYNCATIEEAGSDVIDNYCLNTPMWMQYSQSAEQSI